jgi:uncharacterized cofD-like protein
MKNISVIGGGTGSFVVLSSLKNIKEVNLTAIVPSTDNGGSTGRLKDEFGYLPVGDVRQCLVALAENKEEEFMLRNLFAHRFDKGEEGLKGHNFGNLFLTALRDILGDDLEAIKQAKKILNIQGNVYPVTLNKCNLVAKYENGEKLKGEHNIDEPPYPHDGRLKIKKLYISPKVKTHKAVTDAIKNSELIVICPGDLYSSIGANLVVDGVSQALRKSKAKIVYIVNLMTKFGQTYNFTASDFLEFIETSIGRKVDYVIVNNEILPKKILKKYALQNDYPVVDDLGEDPRIIRADLLINEEIKTPKGDVIKRSLIRHDGEKIKEIIRKLF